MNNVIKMVLHGSQEQLYMKIDCPRKVEKLGKEGKITMNAIDRHSDRNRKHET